MTGRDYSAIADVIRKLPFERLFVAECFAARFAKDDPAFDRTGFLAAALWGIERQADKAVAGPHSGCQSRRAPTPAVGVRIEVGQ